jgi:2-methylcitrate dehydratase PrpD
MSWSRRRIGDGRATWTRRNNEGGKMLEYGAANLHLGITSSLAKFLCEAQFSDLDQAAVHAGKRGVLDWLGCAIAGSGHPTLGKLIDTLVDLGGARNAIVICRDLRLGTIEAALVNGQMGHVLDYDDTHMGGVVLHTSSPTLPAILALAERQVVTGRDLLTAYALAFEAGVRTGQAAPGQRKCGWHLTGTLGTFAAAAATGRLLGLNAEQMTWALGIGGTQAAGMQQNRGTSCKSFHAGRAASNGLLAALLAKRGFDSSGEIIEGKRGFARIYSDTARPDLVLEGIGTSWEISRNGCGVLLHAAIDAVIKASRESGIEPSQVDAIELKVHPNAVLITGLVEPKTGLQSKFSISHTAAVAFIDRAAGITQYSDKRALAPDVSALRQKVSVSADETFGEDQAWATVRSGDRSFEARVEHATGTVDNPMSDKDIEAKFLGNAVPTVGSERARAICERVWQVDRLADVREIINLCA